MFACTSSPSMTFAYDERDAPDYDYGPDWFHVYIYFPELFKEIVMVKAVDIHSAIGNSGGYIGLFLGNVTFSIIEIYNLCFEYQANSSNILYNITRIGCAILQLPDLVIYLRQLLDKWIGGTTMKVASRK